jgi:hypothetical protein
MTLPVPRSVAAACVIGAFLALPPSLLGAERPPVALSERSRISLITILPGAPVYTFAGHSALRVRDPAQDLDRLYNYGTFSFNDPLFIPKFTYGDLRYFLSVAPTAPMMRFYQRQERPVIEQPLTLSRAQRIEVLRFLRRNAQPANRYYQYDFFFDNCSTRIRDALETALGDSVDFSDVPRPSRSFRQLLDPYVASRPGLDLGFDLALGLPADRRPTAREVMFLPEHLMRAFEHATVTTATGERPLVARTDTLHWTTDYQAMQAGFDWPFALGLILLGGVLGWTVLQARTGRQSGRWGDAVFLTAVGTVGLALCYLWFISTYTVTNDNLNLVWAWPTHLFAAYALLRHPRHRALRLYLAATTGAAFLFLAGWPVWPQNVHVAVAPIVAGMGVRTGWWALRLYGNGPAPREVSSPAPEVQSAQ